MQGCSRIKDLCKVAAKTGIMSSDAIGTDECKTKKGGALAALKHQAMTIDQLVDHLGVSTSSGRRETQKLKRAGLIASGYMVALADCDNEIVLALKQRPMKIDD
jgi:predicted ArsR family transcriptional regulator